MRATPVNAVDDRATYWSLVRPSRARYVEVIDQRALPHAVVKMKIATGDAAALAIRRMVVRGAPLIGAVGAYGLALAIDRDPGDLALMRAHAALDAARPTAVNLRWALDRVRRTVTPLPLDARADAAWQEAGAIFTEDVAINHAIGTHGLGLLRDLARKRSGPLNVMTHCNAGALATCAWGTATAPIFQAHAEGMALHVWVSETRPRMQGTHLTAWEMQQRSIPHTVFVDSASGLLMRRGDVDIVLVGADRVARNGDVCNKIGTYDKALAAHDSRVPFYVALPSPTIDWRLATGTDIPIEARSPDEVLTIAGRDDYGQTTVVALALPGTRAVNYAFDVTPGRLVSGFVTERGIARDAQWLPAMYPEQAHAAA